MTNVTMGIYDTHADAEQAIEELVAFGVPESDISYIHKNSDGDMKDEHTGEKVGSGATAGAVTGAVIGGIAGLVVANGILPGIGTLFVAGPLATALGFTGATATTLAGAATGAAAGGLIGALTQLGVSDEDAQLYEKHVQGGDILVIARSETKSTRGIFEKTSAMEVREYTT